MRGENAVTKHRARQEIMHYVFEFCITRHWPNLTPSYYPSLHGFTPAGYDSTGQARVGDLVILKATRRWTKWQIGWLVEIDAREGWPRYLIESLEDESLGWWENVGLEFLPRDELATHPNWRWDDRQFAFADRWNRVCYKERGAYIVLPVPPIFGDGHSVTLGTRTRHSFDEIRPAKTFPDWRKLTKAAMADFYDQCVAERASAIEARRAATPESDAVHESAVAKPDAQGVGHDH